MKITALSDIHSCLDYLKPSSSPAADIKQSDAVLISGDITDFGGDADAEAVIAELKAYNENVFAVPGNCDLNGVDEYLKKQNINLNCNSIVFESFCLAGIGGALSCQRHRGSKTTESDFTLCLEHIIERKLSDKPLIFVCHFPPFHTLVDRTRSGKHGGSRAVREFIEDCQPMLSITGHIHEAAGTDRIGLTTLVNPGSFRQGRYAVIEISDKVENVQIKSA